MRGCVFAMAIEWLFGSFYRLVIVCVGIVSACVRDHMVHFVYVPCDGFVCSGIKGLAGKSDFYLVLFRLFMMVLCGSRGDFFWAAVGAARCDFLRIE